MKNTVLRRVLVAGASVLLLTLLTGMALAGSNENVLVALDLDPADGNQNLITKAEVGGEFELEVYATVTDINGFAVEIGFETDKLAFVSGTVESGFISLRMEAEGALVKADGGLIGSTKSGQVLLATIVFTTLEGFDEATVTVSKASFSTADGMDTPAQNATVLITGTAVESESWGKVKAQFAR